MLNEAKVVEILTNIKYLKKNGRYLTFVSANLSNDYKKIKNGVKVKDVIDFIPCFYFLEQVNNTIESLNLEQVISLLPIQYVLDLV